MTKITLETTVPINYAQHLEQGGRFAGKMENTLLNNMPIKLLNENDYRHASIEISYSKQLSSGFEGNIMYRMHYKTTEKYQERDDDFNIIGEPEDREVIKSHNMINYKMILTALQIQDLLDAALVNVPDTVTGYFNREEMAIGLIALEHVEKFNTFNLAKGQIIIK
jgi:hypothetical protein